MDRGKANTLMAEVARQEQEKEQAQREVLRIKDALEVADYISGVDFHMNLNHMGGGGSAIKNKGISQANRVNKIMSDPSLNIVKKAAEIRKLNLGETLNQINDLEALTAKRLADEFTAAKPISSEAGKRLLDIAQGVIGSKKELGQLMQASPEVAAEIFSLTDDDSVLAELTGRKTEFIKSSRHEVTLKNLGDNRERFERCRDAVERSTNQRELVAVMYDRFMRATEEIASLVQ